MEVLLQNQGLPVPLLKLQETEICSSSLQVNFPKFFASRGKSPNYKEN